MTKRVEYSDIGDFVDETRGEFDRDALYEEWQKGSGTLLLNARNGVIAERIAALRTHLGLNQTVFGRVVGVSQKVITNVERGKTAPPFDLIANIADIYKVDIRWLLGISFAKSKEEDIQVVHRYTGLSEEAIKVLHDNYMVGVLFRLPAVLNELLLPHTSGNEATPCTALEYIFDYLFLDAIHGRVDFTLTNNLSYWAGNDIMMAACLVRITEELSKLRKNIHERDEHFGGKNNQERFRVGGHDKGTERPIVPKRRNAEQLVSDGNTRQES